MEEIEFAMTECKLTKHITLFTKTLLMYSMFSVDGLPTEKQKAMTLDELIEEYRKHDTSRTITKMIGIPYDNN